MKWDKNRKVGEEVSRWYIRAIDSGFMDKYLSGETMLDWGCKGYLTDTQTFHDNAIGVDVDYPNYDGKIFPFPDNYFDAILGSHVLEHVLTEDLNTVIQELYRVLKIGKYLVLTVPHKMLYEKKYENEVGIVPGSHWNGDHKRFYTPASLLTEIERALPPNSYRIELLKDNDFEYNYDIGPEKHCKGCCEIMLVLKKIQKPYWDLMKGISETHTENKIICGGTGKERIVTKNG